MDGEDLLNEVKANLTRIHKIYDYNKDKTFNKWKSGVLIQDILEIIPLTSESEEILRNEGFIKKPYSHFSYLNYFPVFIGDKLK